MKSALLIFVKNPSLGKVKTRLAKTIGDKNALKIYQFLLDHTMEITYQLDMDKFVYYNDYIPTKDEWPEHSYQKELQKGEHLGEKMNNAFHQAFNEDYSKVLLIMPDCPKMSDTLIEKAFKSLDNHDVVIGPTNDDGFYLLGMKKFIPELFKDKTYETATLYKDTISLIEKEGIAYFRSPELVDVDTEEDLGNLKRMVNI
jgi:rSAM/selenodomain-associated transferase 1